MSRDELRKANARGVAKRASTPGVIAARYDRRDGRIVVTLASGLDISFSADAAQGLERARPADLSEIEVSPSRLGLHFPRIDADIYIPALLDGFLGSRNWMAAQLGARGGKARSTAKSRAARRNGKLGGRPRKSAA